MKILFNEKVAHAYDQWYETKNGKLADGLEKELVLKKYNGEPLNKTEQEYFSRKVKKKLEAMTNKEVRKVATAALGRK